MIPREANFEADLEHGVVIYDVSSCLPKHPGKRYTTRRMEDITTIVVHKSGADGPPGFNGLLASVRYCTERKKPQFPGAPYTFWLSREPDKDKDGRRVIYRCQPDTVHSWHTGGIVNRVGVAFGVQGNYDGQWDLIAPNQPKIELEPTDDQWEMLEALYPWAISHYKIDLTRAHHPDGGWAITGHWEHGKPVCPGDALRAWVIRKRGQDALAIAQLNQPHEVFSFTIGNEEVDTTKLNVRELQLALALLGYNPGPIDGMRGFRTREAIEDFQADHGLTADGWYGALTAKNLLEALRKRSLATHDAFETKGQELWQSLSI